jgi:molybdopterin synthase catalytic subunit
MYIRLGLVLKKFSQKTTVTNLAHMYGVLNIDEKKLIVQLGGKSRDETLKPK